MIKVVSLYCPKNHKCPAVIICSVKALSQEGNDAPKIDEELCIKCEKCVRICPKGAIQSEGGK